MCARAPHTQPTATCSEFDVLQLGHTDAQTPTIVICINLLSNKVDLFAILFLTVCPPPFCRLFQHSQGHKTDEPKRNEKKKKKHTNV